jgi:hypothetical protein
MKNKRSTNTPEKNDVFDFKELKKVLTIPTTNHWTKNC